MSDHQCVCSVLHVLGLAPRRQHLSARPTGACGIYLNWLTRGQHRHGKRIPCCLRYEGRHKLVNLLSDIEKKKTVDDRNHLKGEHLWDYTLKYVAEPLRKYWNCIAC